MTLAVNLKLNRGSLNLDIEFDTHDGKVVALVGPNGAGKTTTLRAIAGLQEIADGKVLIDGKNITNVDVARRQVGYLPQDLQLFGHMSVLENVAFGLRAQKIRKVQARHLAHTIIERLDLVDLVQKKPRELSIGQSQSVALARALVLEPRVLLLDEPTSALDVNNARRLVEVVKAYVKDFNAVAVVVTHDEEFLAQFIDKTIRLGSGHGQTP